MANALFDYAKNQMLQEGVHWVNDTIGLVLVDHTDDTPDPASDQNLDDILAAARVHTAAAGLANTSVSAAGVADADDKTLSAVTGDAADSIVLYIDTGNEATSTLVVFIDTATGLPVTPNGGDIDVVWDDGANKIFAL